MDVIHLHLGGHLNFFGTAGRANIEIEAQAPRELAALLLDLKVPLGEVAFVSVNGELVPLEGTRVGPGDKVQVYPPMGGG